MAPLNALLAAAMLWVAAPVSADPIGAWHDSIAEASARFGIPEVWIRGVIRAESGGYTQRAGAPIRSRVGAIGLMQLMPHTWAAMRDAYRLGPNPDDPRDNILAGTAYLRLMYDRFGYPGLFAGYNAGPERYARFLAGGPALPLETEAYVAAVSRATDLRNAVYRREAETVLAVRGLPAAWMQKSPSTNSIFAIPPEIETHPGVLTLAP